MLSEPRMNSDKACRQRTDLCKCRLARWEPEEEYKEDDTRRRGELQKDEGERRTRDETDAEKRRREEWEKKREKGKDRNAQPRRGNGGGRDG